MQLTTHTDHALRMLMYLMINPERNITTREVAETFGVSIHHLTKVAKSLVKGGWLLSTRGAGGGLVLAPHTPNAKVGDIVRHTENMGMVVCFTEKTPRCPIEAVCRLRSVIHRARQAFFEVLDGVTVAEVSGNKAELGLILNPPTRRAAVTPPPAPKPRGKPRKS